MMTRCGIRELVEFLGAQRCHFQFGGAFPSIGCDRGDDVPDQRGQLKAELTAPFRRPRYSNEKAADTSCDRTHRRS